MNCRNKMDKNKKKILIIGSESYVATNFVFKYKSNYSKIFLFSYKSADDSFKLNLFDPDLNLLDKIIDNNFEYALISASITNLSICEKEKKYTYLCNVEGVAKIAKFLAQRNIIPIIFSSDYVFDGKEGGYTENSPHNPLNQYGIQKAELEKKIFEDCNDNFLLLRLSKIVSFKKDDTLFNQIIKGFLNNQSVESAYDQIFCPIEIGDLLEIINLLQRKNCRGIFNLCGTEMWSRYNLANQIIKKIYLNESLLKKISLDDLREPFIRPKNTTMKCDKLLSHIDFQFMTMDSCIDNLLKNYSL